MLSRFVDFSASSDNTPEVKNPDKVCAKDIGNSMVILKTGELVMDHELPSVRSLNTTSGLRFVYNSISAYPSALISFDADLDTSLTEIPSTTTFRATVEGVTDEATYDGVEGEVRYAYLFEGRNGRGEWLGTGSYPFEIEISNDYDSLTYWTADNFGGIPILDTGVLTDEPVSFTRTINGRIFLNNLRNSPFGVGWSLAGLQRLHFDLDGSMLLTDGDSMILTLQLREKNPI